MLDNPRRDWLHSLTCFGVSDACRTDALLSRASANPSHGCSGVPTPADRRRTSRVLTTYEPLCCATRKSDDRPGEADTDRGMLSYVRSRLPDDLPPEATRERELC